MSQGESQGERLPWPHPAATNAHPLQVTKIARAQGGVVHPLDLDRQWQIDLRRPCSRHAQGVCLNITVHSVIRNLFPALDP